MHVAQTFIINEGGGEGDGARLGNEMGHGPMGGGKGNGLSQFGQ